MHDGLRFDKVAVRFIEQISAGVEHSVPIALTESVFENRTQMYDDRAVNYIRRAVLSI